MEPGDRAVIPASQLEPLIGALRQRGYTVVGPRPRDGAVVYDVLDGASDLPVGWTDLQAGGSYRLEKSDSPAYFGFRVGPHSWKQLLHPPTLTRWRARRDDGGFTIDDTEPAPPRYAFLGVRACELSAIRIQDRVFLGGPYVDASYRTRREGAFLVAVNCAEAGGTCFCASMKTGPRVGPGFDLALTELLDGGRHDFLLEVGTKEGAEVAGELRSRPAAAADLAASEAASRHAEETMGRRLETEGLPELLCRRYEDPRWDEVARRCLACANCTMVCPTCFCATVEDVTDLRGQEAERRRRWDSCFTLDFSYVHGGSIRTSPGARYRQWITHKLATWHDQFGTSGCVGCGRCITWCPVGIDITEEARALQGLESQGG